MMSRLVRLTLVILLLTLAAGSAAVAQDDTKAAQTAVESWLALVDKESYAAGWDEGAAAFKSAISQQMWEAAVQQARGSVGTLKMRTLKSAMPTSAPPNAPPGEYIIFQYASSFERNPTAAETVVAMREKDAGWRVGGYFIK